MSHNNTENTVLEKPSERLRHSLEQRCAQVAPEHVAVIAEEGAYPFRERDDPAKQTARDLLDRGSKPGDRVRTISEMVTTTIRMTAWLLLLATVVLSLAPPWYHPLPEFPFIDIPRSGEHFAIFLAAGLAFGVGYRAPYLSQLALITLFAASVEIAQLLAPGRHARLSDFLIDALGATVGLVIGRALIRFSGQRRLKILNDVTKAPLRL